MPLPREVLDDLKTRIDKAEKLIKSMEDVVTDLRASGIDASKQEEKLTIAKDRLQQMRTFYELQSKRPE